MSAFAWMPRAVAVALLVVPIASAADELAEIREQINSLKSSYEARIRALEERLKQAEGRAAQPARAAAAPLPTAPSSGGGSLAAFNPAISAILSGTYAHLSRDPEEFAIAGFAPRGEIGPGRRGFGLGESELVLTANVDPHFVGSLTVALAPDDTLAIEEAHGTFLTAPYGLTPKFGRFFSGLGYLNEQHAHTWDFVDAPLAYQAFLGGKYATDGVQVKWLAPTEHFIELGAEAGNGDAFPGVERSRNGAGAGVLFAHSGGDLGASHSWRAGVSYLRTRAEDDRRSRLAVADFVWKYAPDGNARETNAKLQGEYFAGRTGEDARQSGWYLQALWQFMPQWRLGARYDRLDAAIDFRPRRASVVVEYNPSEFSRFRLQFARSETQPGIADNQWFVQYILSLGAHGAHRY